MQDKYDDTFRTFKHIIDLSYSEMPMGKSMNRIRYYISILYTRYEYRYPELLSDLTDFTYRFVDSGKYDKFDVDKGTFFTFCMNALVGLLRMKLRSIRLSYDRFIEQENGISSLETDMNVLLKHKDNQSNVVYGMDSLTSNDPSPEAALLNEQTLCLAHEYFTETELDYMSGAITIRQAATLSGIPKSTYEDRLNKKIMQFRKEM